jgi:hypothetical protein
LGLLRSSAASRAATASSISSRTSCS